jgi:uncharacterized protein YqjF (DUF2071 family)
LNEPERARAGCYTHCVTRNLVKPFLTAEWRSLAMLNYRVAREVLEPLVPRDTTLDAFQGMVYVSLVGFLFLQTKVRGLSIPWHRDFEEVNLRFYVGRQTPEGWRRGVVFIKEIVPRLAIAAVARIFYHENYIARPMRHAVGPAAAEYRWRCGGKWCRLAVRTSGSPSRPAAGSLEQFITEHYWGYAPQRDGACLEYRVDHLPWRVAPADEAVFEGEAAGLYGRQLAAVLQAKPASAFLAEGSPVTVVRGRRLAPE